MIGRHNLALPGVTWIKSTRSTGSGANCVEVTRNLPGVVAIRDSKDPGGLILAVPASNWRQFTHTLKTGAPTT